MAGAPLLGVTSHFILGNKPSTPQPSLPAGRTSGEERADGYCKAQSIQSMTRLVSGWSLAVQSLPQQRRDGVVPILLRIPQSRSAVVAHQSLVRARLEQQLDGSREVYIRRPCSCDCWPRYWLSWTHGGDRADYRCKGRTRVARAGGVRGRLRGRPVPRYASRTARSACQAAL